MLLSVRVPADNDRGPRFMQEALAAIHQANRRRLPFALEIGCRDDCVGLFIRCDEAMEQVIVTAISAKYPNGRIDRLEESDGNESQPRSYAMNLVLSPDLFPILRHSQFEDVATGAFADPVDALLRSVEPNPRDPARISIRLTPTSPRRHRWARRVVEKLNLVRYRRFWRGVVGRIRGRISSFCAPLDERWVEPSLGFLLGLFCLVSRAFSGKFSNEGGDAQ